MRKADHLIDEVLSLENLEDALWKASNGRRDRSEVQEVYRELDRLGNQFRQWIWNGQIMEIFTYRRFVIRDPGERVVHTVPFLASVLHHAIINVFGPVLEKNSITHSYACKGGLANLKALQAARNFTRGRKAFLRMGIHRFFDSVDQRILMKSLEDIIDDMDLEDIFNCILFSYNSTPRKGLPMGTLISHYLGNFHLDPLDQYIHEVLGCRSYVRFMDEFILWDNDRARLEIWMDDLTQLLDKNLHLEIAPDSGTGWSAEGFAFLGYQVTPDSIQLSDEAQKEFRNQLAQLESQFFDGEISEEELVHRSRALFSFADHYSGGNWRREIVESSLGWHLY